MAQDYSNKSWRKISFKNEDLRNANFSGTDLRGADFSGSDLTGANFTGVRTGVTPGNTIRIFLIALAVSLFSGYMAMLAGHTMQQMVLSPDPKIKYAGIASIIISVVFIIYAYVKGGGNAIYKLILPVVTIAILLGFMSFVLGVGSGKGMLYLIVALFLIVVMFIVGTIARAAAGTLSNILFLIVALSGGIFGKSLGGGVGAFIMAIACMQISKKALKGAKGFEVLQMVALSITRRFGTSFRNSKLSGANFTNSKIRNADFTHADVTGVKWGDSNRINCIMASNGLTVVKDETYG